MTEVSGWLSNTHSISSVRDGACPGPGLFLPICKMGAFSCLSHSSLGFMLCYGHLG